MSQHLKPCAFCPKLHDAFLSGNPMDTPQGVWRHSLERIQSIQASNNLLNIDTWPSWNSSAQRVLSSTTGSLSEGQRFDLHRIECQRLVEELWSVKTIRTGTNPDFSEIEFEWLGQQREGKHREPGNQEVSVRSIDRYPRDRPYRPSSLRRSAGHR